MPRVKNFRNILAGMFPTLFPIPIINKLYPQLFATIRFQVGEILPFGHTTERESTGQQGYEFRIYPLLTITGDVNGNYGIRWGFENKFDGQVVYDSVVDKGDIVNTFSGLIAGQPYQERLIDVTASGQERGGAIAIGDIDFQDLQAQDGQWHSFQTNVSGVVDSPSNEQVSFQGQWGPENFRSWYGALIADLGFDETMMQLYDQRVYRR